MQFAALPGAGISIHALREEGDQGECRQRHRRGDFYPRPPRGGRRFAARWARKSSRFLSTPSARRATRPLTLEEGAENISIHALREEGDLRIYHDGPGSVAISIHALREEGDSAAA